MKDRILNTAIITVSVFLVVAGSSNVPAGVAWIIQAAVSAFIGIMFYASTAPCDECPIIPVAAWQWWQNDYDQLERLCEEMGEPTTRMNHEGVIQIYSTREQLLVVQRTLTGQLTGQYMFIV